MDEGKQPATPGKPFKPKGGRRKGAGWPRVGVPAPREGAGLGRSRSPPRREGSAGWHERSFPTLNPPRGNRGRGNKEGNNKNRTSTVRSREMEGKPGGRENGTIPVSNREKDATRGRGAPMPRDGQGNSAGWPGKGFPPHKGGEGPLKGGPRSKGTRGRDPTPRKPPRMMRANQPKMPPSSRGRTWAVPQLPLPFNKNAR